jgi:transposase
MQGSPHSFRGGRRGEWTTRSKRKVNRVPYGFLRQALRHVAERNGVAVVEVDPRYTSQACLYCGHTGKENWVCYSYFKCRACDYEANRDRAASLNIALRAAQTQDALRAFNMNHFFLRGKPPSVA